ncbi:MAG: hypothetical protein Q9M94_02010 [Candidatus Gracilibacteria bacterium]|nr:hypothetical protein [Candidatus Gracilibacteria bacterium]MDQ7023539.1 hypothetical protein [Candidatus Gracilibacteria bacterium]
MTKVNTTIRLDNDLKNEAMSIATELGTNLSTVIALYLKNNFLIQRGLNFKLRDEYGFTKEASEDLERELDEIDKGIDISKPYSNVNNLIHDLRNNAVKY